MNATRSQTLVEAARSLAPLVSEHADAAELERHAQAPVVEALNAAGILHMLVPRALGGAEAHPAEFLAVIEDLARADASAAWIAMIAATSAATTAYLDPASAREILGDPPTAILSGITNPSGTATPTDGGHIVNGRWTFGSGCQHADWIALSGMVRSPNGDVVDARFSILPISEIEIVDTWDVAGLRATGSHDVLAHNVFVPAERSYSIVTGKPQHSGSLYRFSLIGLLAVAVASVALGIGRGALDDLKSLAPTKVPFGRKRPLSDWGVAQTQIAEAEAALRSGRAFLIETIDDMWDAVERGDDPTNEQRALVRLAATQATRGAVVATDTAFNLAGGSAIYSTSLLQRRFRDIHTLTQHVMVGPSSMEAAGRALLGLSVPPGFL